MPPVLGAAAEIAAGGGIGGSAVTGALSRKYLEAVTSGGGREGAAAAMRAPHMDVWRQYEGSGNSINVSCGIIKRRGAGNNGGRSESARCGAPPPLYS